MTILAHRGVTAQARDNSADALLLVAQAANQGLDVGIEMDIRAVVDELVLNHDPFEWGVPLFNVELAELAVELGNDCPIKLEDGLNILRNVPVVNIELKEAGTSRRVVELVLQHCQTTGQPLSSFIFVSFIPKVVAELKQIDSRLVTGMLIDGNLTSSRPTPDRVCLTLYDNPTEEAISVAETMWKVADRVGADFLSPHWTRLSRRVLELAADRSKRILPWSVNNAHLMKALVEDHNVSHIVTDFPEMIHPEMRPATTHRKLAPLSDSE